MVEQHDKMHEAIIRMKQKIQQLPFKKRLSKFSHNRGNLHLLNLHITLQWTFLLFLLEMRDGWSCPDNIQHTSSSLLQLKRKPTQYQLKNFHVEVFHSQLINKNKHLKEGIEVKAHQKLSKKWCSLTSRKTAAAQYCIKGIGLLIELLHKNRQIKGMTNRQAGLLRKSYLNCTKNLLSE